MPVVISGVVIKPEDVLQTLRAYEKINPVNFSGIDNWACGNSNRIVGIIRLEKQALIKMLPQDFEKEIEWTDALRTSLLRSGTHSVIEKLDWSAWIVADVHAQIKDERLSLLLETGCNAAIKTLQVDWDQWAKHPVTGLYEDDKVTKILMSRYIPAMDALKIDWEAWVQKDAGGLHRDRIACLIRSRHNRVIKNLNQIVHQWAHNNYAHIFMLARFQLLHFVPSLNLAKVFSEASEAQNHRLRLSLLSSNCEAYLAKQAPLEGWKAWLEAVIDDGAAYNEWLCAIVASGSIFVAKAYSKWSKWLQAGGDTALRDARLTLVLQKKHAGIAKCYISWRKWLVAPQALDEKNARRLLALQSQLEQVIACIGGWRDWFDQLTDPKLSHTCRLHLLNAHAKKPIEELEWINWARGNDEATRASNIKAILLSKNKKIIDKLFTELSDSCWRALIDPTNDHHIRRTFINTAHPRAKALISASMTHEELLKYGDRHQQLKKEGWQTWLNEGDFNKKYTLVLRYACNDIVKLISAQDWLTWLQGEPEVRLEHALISKKAHVVRAIAQSVWQSWASTDIKKMLIITSKLTGAMDAFSPKKWRSWCDAPETLLESDARRIAILKTQNNVFTTKVFYISSMGALGDRVSYASSR